MRRSIQRGPKARDEAIEELLQHARTDGFTPKDTGELWSQLGAITGAANGGGGGAPSPAGGPAAGAGGGIWGAKMIAALALGGSVVAGAGLAATRMPGLAWQEPAPAASSGSPEETARSDRDAPAAVPRSTASADPGIEGNGAAGSVLGATLPPARSTLASPLPSDSPTRSTGPRRILPTGAQPTAGAQVPAVSPPRAGTNAAETNVPSVDNVQSVEAPEPTPAPPAAPPPNEGELLLRARHELGSSPTETLGLTEQHAKLFPAGTLVPEREVLAIEALAQLGRSSAARARLADFRARFPHSPHLARLEAIVDR